MSLIWQIRNSDGGSAFGGGWCHSDYYLLKSKIAKVIEEGEIDGKCVVMPLKINCFPILLSVGLWLNERSGTQENNNRIAGVKFEVQAAPGN